MAIPFNTFKKKQNNESPSFNDAELQQFPELNEFIDKYLDPLTKIQKQIDTIDKESETLPSNLIEWKNIVMIDSALSYLDEKLSDFSNFASKTGNDWIDAKNTAVTKDAITKLSLIKHSFEVTKEELQNIVWIKWNILDIKAGAAGIVTESGRAEGALGDIVSKETKFEIEKKISNETMHFFNEEDYRQVKDIAKSMETLIKEYKWYKSSFNIVEIEDVFEAEIKQDDYKFMKFITDVNSFLSRMTESNTDIEYINSKASIIAQYSSKVDFSGLDNYLWQKMPFNKFEGLEFWKDYEKVVTSKLSEFNWTWDLATNLKETILPGLKDLNWYESEVSENWYAKKYPFAEFPEFTKLKWISDFETKLKEYSETLKLCLTADDYLEKISEFATKYSSTISSRFSKELELINKLSKAKFSSFVELSGNTNKILESVKSIVDFTNTLLKIASDYNITVDDSYGISDKVSIQFPGYFKSKKLISWINQAINNKDLDTAEALVNDLKKLKSDIEGYSNAMENATDEIRNAKSRINNMDRSDYGNGISVNKDLLIWLWLGYIVNDLISDYQDQQNSIAAEIQREAEAAERRRQEAAAEAERERQAEEERRRRQQQEDEEERQRQSRSSSSSSSDRSSSSSSSNDSSSSSSDWSSSSSSSSSWSDSYSGWSDSSW